MNFERVKELTQQYRYDEKTKKCYDVNNVEITENNILHDEIKAAFACKSFLLVDTQSNVVKSWVDHANRRIQKAKKKKI